MNNPRSRREALAILDDYLNADFRARFWTQSAYGAAVKENFHETTTSALLALAFALPASAFTPAAVDTLGNGVHIFTLCDAEGAAETGVCDDGASVDIGARVTGFTHLTFDSTQSTGTTYRCDIYAGNDSVAKTADLSTVGAQINSVSLSSSVEVIGLDGVCPTSGSRARPAQAARTA